MSKASTERWWIRMQFSVEQSAAKRQLREYHYYKQGGFCAYCDCQMRIGDKTPVADSVTLEHIIPQRWGGRNVAQETIAVCYKCNQTRRDFPLPLALLWRVFVYNGVDSIPAIMYNVEAMVKNKIHDLALCYLDMIVFAQFVIR